MNDHPSVKPLAEAVQRYFDLMYDCDTSRFDRVFRSTAQLHGFREGEMTVWPAPNTRRSSPAGPRRSR